MDKVRTLVVNDDGTLVAVYGDDLLEIIAEGDATVTRASHVEPAIGGGWTADLAPAGGPLLEGFSTRAAALAAEVAWLEGKLTA